MCFSPRAIRSRWRSRPVRPQMAMQIIQQRQRSRSCFWHRRAIGYKTSRGRCATRWRSSMIRSCLVPKISIAGGLSRPPRRWRRLSCWWRRGRQLRCESRRAAQDRPRTGHADPSPSASPFGGLIPREAPRATASRSTLPLAAAAPRRCLDWPRSRRRRRQRAVGTALRARRQRLAAEAAWTRPQASPRLLRAPALARPLRRRWRRRC